VWRPSYRSAAPAQATPGSLIDSPKSPEPCMPTPTIPNRTVSLGGMRRARSDVGARDAPTAAPLSSRNSRRDQVGFIATLSLVCGLSNGTGLIDPHPPTRRGDHLLRIESHAVLEDGHHLADHRRIGGEIAVEQHQIGVLPRLDRADASLKPEDARSVQRYDLHCLLGAEAGLAHQLVAALVAIARQRAAVAGGIHAGPEHPARRDERPLERHRPL